MNTSFVLVLALVLLVGAFTVVNGQYGGRFGGGRGGGYGGGHNGGRGGKLFQPLYF